MDNENTVLTEQGESVETSTDFDAVFDTGWDEEVPEHAVEETVETAGAGTARNAKATDEEGEGTEADADQQDAEGSDGEESDGASAEEGESKGDKGDPDQGSSFTLRHLGEERTVDREEVIKLAQQGMDYPRIREKWDAVKDDVPKLRMYESFLKELADARGSDIESLIDETRTRAILARAEANGEKFEPSSAAARAVKMRTEFVPADTKSQQEKEAEKEAKGQQEIERFVKEYPDVQAEEIPKEVWDAVNENDGDLLGCYQRYENRKLREDVKRLASELEAVKNQQKNKERSTGSAKSVGSGPARDAFDEGWDL